MNRKPLTLALALAFLPLVFAALQGCSQPAEPSSSSAQEQKARGEAVPQTGTASSVTPAEAAKSTGASASGSIPACGLVTAEEMSAILGSTVVAEPGRPSSDKITCVYRPVKGFSPSVEVSLEWGGGEGMMVAMGTMQHIEPGISNPYEGLGDQAAAVGPALMIRRGEDLITLTFSGVGDATRAAKKIYDTAQARM